MVYLCIDNEQQNNDIMKQTFIIKASKSAIRVDEKYVLDSYNPYLYASDYDFSVIQFASKDEMRKAFAGIAKPVGETFFIDNNNGAAYIKVDAQGRTKAADFMFLASMIKPYAYTK